MTLLDVRKIRTNGGTQCRAKLDDTSVRDYAEAMKRGDVFPPLVVFYDGADYWLADGFHRLEAAEEANRTEIECEVRRGTARDAIFFAAGANVSSQVRRTNEDKRRAALTLLNDPEWVKLSNVEIARHCGVSDEFVRQLRASLPTVGSERPAERTYTTKHGTVATMQVGNIGRSREPRDEEAPRPAVSPRVESTVGRSLTPDTPEDQQHSRAAVFTLDGLDRLLAAAEHWEDAADAVPHLTKFQAFSEKLPIVAAWLARLAECWDARSSSEPR